MFNFICFFHNFSSIILFFVQYLYFFKINIVFLISNGVFYYHRFVDLIVDYIFFVFLYLYFYCPSSLYYVRFFTKTSYNIHLWCLDFRLFMFLLRNIVTVFSNLLKIVVMSCFLIIHNIQYITPCTHNSNVVPLILFSSYDY